MKRVVLAMGLLLPGLAMAQGTGGVPAGTPGPTANPATSNSPQAVRPGLYGTNPQGTPSTSPVPATPPSGAPPDVVVVPK